MAALSASGYTHEPLQRQVLNPACCARCAAASTGCQHPRLSCVRPLREAVKDGTTSSPFSTSFYFQPASILRKQLYFTIFSPHIYVPQKSFIKTFGCQMVSTTRTRWSGCWAAQDTSSPTTWTRPISSLQPARCARGAGEGVSDLGRVQAPRMPKACRLAWVAALPAGGEEIIKRARLWTWCLARRPCTACPTC